MQRAYKAAMPHDKARSIIIEEAGKQFDPKVIEAFLRAEHKFRLCAEHHNARQQGEIERPSYAVAAK